MLIESESKEQEKLQPAQAPLPKAWRKVAHAVGLDRPIAFTAAGRVVQGVGSVLNVVLILHFLSAKTQGYYYVLWSLVALQQVFELGFSFVILQVAAHEWVHLRIEGGTVTGDLRALRRLASLLQRTVRWYMVAAIAMGPFLLLGGEYFLGIHSSEVDIAVWIWPLRLTVLACVLLFVLTPLLSFVEGCGQVTAVAQIRFAQSVASAVSAAAALFIHQGLYAPAAVLFSQAVVALYVLWSRRSWLLALLRMKAEGDEIRWREEVWPFQWKIAVSWLCDYFIFQLFTPVVFFFSGPAEAGRMGLSLNVVTRMAAMMLVWMTTKAAPFGNLIAKKDIPALDTMFFRSFRQSMLLLTAGALLLLGAVLAVPLVAPHIAQRILPWPAFLLLLLTAICGNVVQCEAIYLRAHKCEPFLLQSIVVATATCIGVLLMTKQFGTMGASLAGFIVLGMFGTISATLIFNSRRKAWGYTPAAGTPVRAE